MKKRCGGRYFGYVQGCTCSYGKTKIEGCSEATQEMFGDLPPPPIDDIIAPPAKYLEPTAAPLTAAERDELAPDPAQARARAALIACGLPVMP